jgi:hypothetical protein
MSCIVCKNFHCWVNEPPVCLKGSLHHRALFSTKGNENLNDVALEAECIPRLYVLGQFLIRAAKCVQAVVFGTSLQKRVKQQTMANSLRRETSRA